MNLAELIGYAGSVIILISLLMKSLLKLRWINLAGSILFSLYGLMIKAWPVFGINVVIVFIDAWFIFKMSRRWDYFALVPLSEIGTAYFRKFFLYFENDIRAFFPDIAFESLAGPETYILFRNMAPVGFFALRLEGEEAHVVGDYVAPEYRDFKTGKFVYDVKRMYFKEKGIKRFVADYGKDIHSKYLIRNGFKTDDQYPDLLVKHL